MKVTITPFDRALLLANSETKALTCELMVADGSALEGSPSQCSELREGCAELLMRIGFDEAYAATTEGVALERLIDNLHIE